MTSSALPLLFAASRRVAILVAVALLLAAGPAESKNAREPAREWFQSTEQALMDAIASGDKVVWERVLDGGFIYTSEDGQVLSRQELLKELTGLPPGLSGSIKVEDLTVQEFPGFAVVRFLGNESEDVFGQKLRVRYRITDTFRRTGHGWKLIASHVSVVTADPSPQEVAKDSWPRLAGVYRLMPEGWKLYVVLRDGGLSAGRDLDHLRPLIPLAPNAFVRQGAPGELIFVPGPDGKIVKIVDFRKFQPLIWTRVDSSW